MAPAKIQAPRSERRAPAAGLPQRWQKRAWAERSAPHPSQLRWVRLAPQLPQNRPAAGPPQAGQDVVVGVVIAAGR